MKHFLRHTIVALLMTSSLFFTPIEAKIRKIIFLGDSLTAGYQLPQQQAFPALIGKKLVKTEWKTVNAGISGDTSAGGLSRINWILKGQPDIVVIALGANDGLRGTALWTMQNNLDKIVIKSQEAGASVVIIGMQLPTNYGADFRKRFAAVFKNIAQKNVILYIPFLLEGVAMDPELNLSDGLHPNAKGHEIIANHIYKELLPLLEKRERGQL